MKLSPWFHVGKYGAPVHLGWYDFELWITPDHEVLCSVLHIRAEYVGNMFITLRNGRRVQLTYDDFWRGVTKSSLYRIYGVQSHHNPCGELYSTYPFLNDTLRLSAMRLLKLEF